MDAINKAIWNKFHIHHGDILPYKAFQGDRIALAQLFGELGFNKGAEIGVEMGRYSKHMLENNPKLQIMCVDPWEPFSHHSVSNMEATYQNARARLARFENRVTFIRKRSVDAARDVPNDSLDFVYIDGLHDFDSCMSDILAWVPKVRKGGIVSGHDYLPLYQYGVVAAVDAYTRAHNIFMWYITKETEAPQAHSWIWVKG